jgi:glycosyltransferase involved in cell wall biosynthesis
MKIVHVITSLETGGAQMMLVKLLRTMDRDAFTSEVISLAPLGPMADLVRPVASRVTSVEMRPRLRDLPAILRLRRMLRESRPDVVQTWMYHADVVGGLAAKTSVDAPVLWNIRSGSLETKRVGALVRLGATLSRRVPARIVGCSERALAFHAALGYDASRFVLIPNGFELDRFAPDLEARSDVRQELGLPAHALLVGMVARVDPIKDHAMFLAAAARVRQELPDVNFVLCGDGVLELPPAPHLHRLGRRMDIARITAALDLACSSSYGEGFPNSIGEAMACAVPAVVTDVGDSAALVGDTGRVVPPRDHDAFAAALFDLLRLDPAARRELGQAARARVAEHFEIGTIARRYESLYREVARR